jgi:hypothetical protein
MIPCLTWMILHPFSTYCSSLCRTLVRKLTYNCFRSAQLQQTKLDLFNPMWSTSCLNKSQLYDPITIIYMEIYSNTSMGSLGRKFVHAATRAGFTCGSPNLFSILAKIHIFIFIFIIHFFKAPTFNSLF